MDSKELIDDFDRLSKQEQHRWLQLDILDKQFNLWLAGQPKVDSFLSLNSKKDYQIRRTWKVSRQDNSFALCLISYDTVFEHPSRTHVPKPFYESHLYFFGYLKLNSDFGAALVRPETLRDKINDFFEPVDIDFESHRQFSRQYYVVARDKEKFLSSLPDEFLTFTQGVTGLQVEFQGHECLFRLSKAISESKTDVHVLCKVGIVLDRILNSVASA